MASPRQARATLRQVADLARVSVSTASLVFSGKGPVAPATADRVRAAAEQIGFTGPDPRASSLRHGRAGAVGVLVEGRLRMAFRDPFAIAVLDGLAEVLDTVPTGMLLVGQTTDDPASLVPQLAGLAVDAVVFSLCGPGENPAVAHLAARGIPMFSTGVPDDPRVTQVRIDERAAFAQVAGHVRDLGHTRVATVTMPLSTRAVAGVVSRDDPAVRSGSAPSTERLLGFRDVFGPDAPAVQTADGSSVEGGLAAGRLLLDVAPATRPTAVVAQSDVIAAGVIRAAEDLGLRVPEDLSVTGFDGVELPWLPHRLTTIDQGGHEKGRLLGEMVRRALDGTRPRSRTQTVTLRVGTTTAPPR